MNSQTPAISDLLYLLTIPNIGPGRIRRLFQVFHTFREIQQAPAQQLIRVEGIDLKLARQLKKGGNQKAADEQLELIEKHGVCTLTIWDKEYPEQLKQISDPPLILFYRGQAAVLKKNCIAVVGTRNPSNSGKLAAHRLSAELAERGVVVVSGLARGIDTIAHQQAISAGGETAAVLGCGIDRCYPAENSKLFKKIMEHGVILTEYFIGVGPDAANFPKRNRIISGLSLGTLVVEAGDRSGALITAIYALNQNREVFAVPGSIDNPKSRGSNGLIRQGAKLVQTVEDIFEELPALNRAAAPRKRELPASLSEFEKRIISCLDNEALHIDRLVMILGESPALILSALLSLELQGLIKQLPGKMFARL